MTAGVPVVATRVGGVPELAPAGHRRCSSPPGRPGALAAAIGRAARRSRRSREAQARGRAAHVEATGGAPRDGRAHARALRERCRAMRVLLATPGTDVGGAERVVIALAHALPRRGHEVVLWGPAGALEPELAGAPLERVVVPDRGRSAAGVAERRREPRRRDAAHAPAGRARAQPARRRAGGGRASGSRAARAARRVLATFHGVPRTRVPRARPRCCAAPTPSTLRLRGPRRRAARRRASRPTALHVVPNSVAVPPADPAARRRARRRARAGRRAGRRDRRPARRAEEPRPLPGGGGAGRAGAARRALPRRRRRAAAGGAGRAGARARARRPGDASPACATTCRRSPRAPTSSCSPRTGRACRWWRSRRSRRARRCSARRSRACESCATPARRRSCRRRAPRRWPPASSSCWPTRAAAPGWAARGRELVAARYSGDAMVDAYERLYSELSRWRGRAC